MESGEKCKREIKYSLDSSSGKLAYRVGTGLMIWQCEFLRCGFLAAVSLMWISTPASAQGQAAGANRQAFELKGSLLGMQRGLIQVAADADKKEYIVKLPSDLDKVRYSGQALKEWLSGGMFIRFDVQMDEKGKVIGAVKQLEVFVPNTKLPDTPDNRKNNVLGVYPANVPGAENLFSDEKKKVVIKTFRVVARVGGLSKNKLMAIAGTNRLQVELDDAVSINVSVPGFELCQVGDSVNIRGFVYPDQPGWVDGDSVSFVGKETLGQKPAKGTKASARNKRDAKEPADKNAPPDDSKKPKN